MRQKLLNYIWLTPWSVAEFQDSSIFDGDVLFEDDALEIRLSAEAADQAGLSAAKPSAVIWQPKEVPGRELSKWSLPACHMHNCINIYFLCVLCSVLQHYMIFKLRGSSLLFVAVVLEDMMEKMHLEAAKSPSHNLTAQSVATLPLVSQVTACRTPPEGMCYKKLLLKSSIIFGQCHLLWVSLNKKVAVESLRWNRHLI